LIARIEEGGAAMIGLGPLGDRAFLARFATEDEAARWVAAVRGRGWPGVEDVVLAYQTAAVHADPDRIDLAELEGRLRTLEAAEPGRGEGRLIAVPVLYDGADLAEVARRRSMTEEEVIAHHVGNDYRVFAIGFLPGFPYAGYLPASLSGLPRRESPRAEVPAGSVAIAGRQTGIYPESSPGGWHLLGRTPLRIVDYERGDFPIRAGDRIRFRPIGTAEFEAMRGERLRHEPADD
jgi:KipI family sensor histidine kinase inhibitor